MKLKTFKDIKFKPHTTGEGLMGKIFFHNGYGISVVRFKMPSMPSTALIFRSEGTYGSYTSNETEWEIAVLKGDKKDAEITYDTPITDDVIGYLTETEVTDIMKQIQELPINHIP
jgi:hypothetical protein